ncbi:hypothetical protein ACC699_36105, partial [Rhizobium ruizarguesonis]
PKWLRTATRRYRTNNSNQKPLERTQDWIKLGGKVRDVEEQVIDRGRERQDGGECAIDVRGCSLFF